MFHENAGESGSESNGLICLTEGILRNGGVQAVAWLPFTALIHSYNEKEQQKWSQKDIKNVLVISGEGSGLSLGEKTAASSCRH